MKTKFLIYLFIAIYLTSMPTYASKQLRIGPLIAHKIYDEYGFRVGTCRRENTKFQLYDMHEKLVQNPAKYLNQPADECYLYDMNGYAIGKCTSTRVILFRF